MANHFVYEEDLDRIELEDGEWVDIKRQMSVGDYDRIEKGSEGAMSESRILEVLLTNIKAWSLKGKDDKVAPIDRETIAMLDTDTATLIITEIGKRNSPPKKV